jgi:hypothetical protein
MFNGTFFGFAQNSTTGTIPVNLFDTIDTGSGTIFTNMFQNTFTNYARRSATFVVGGLAVLTSPTFQGPYSTKNISTDNTPSTNPTVATGDIIIPTYNDTVRTITAPTGTYSGYLWYYKDGTSCSVSTPTPDCGLQDGTTLASFPSGINTTEWTPTTSTEKGNVTYYGIPATLTLSTCGTVNIFVSMNKFSSVYCPISITTNNPNGMTLSVMMANNTLTNGGTGTIPATTGTLFAPTTLTGTTPAWGIRFSGAGTFGSSTTVESNVSSSTYTWAAVPTTDTAVRNTSTASTDNLDIYYGASAGSLPPGTYSTTPGNEVAWTLVANP